MKKMKIIQCQEEVSRDKRLYRNKDKPTSVTQKESNTHQCTLTARYRIDSIDLYVCTMHASGIDKNQLIEI